VMFSALSCRALATAVKKPNYIQLYTCDIQGAAKKDPSTKTSVSSKRRTIFV